MEDNPHTENWIDKSAEESTSNLSRKSPPKKATTPLIIKSSNNQPK